MDVWFEAYGCTANQGETRELAERARELGHPLAESAEGAATVVLGTCTVIEATQRRLERRIAELQKMGKRVVVGGCMATADRTRLRQRFPEAALLHPGDSDGLAALLGPGPRGDHRPATAEVTAILPIAAGCLGRCTYCATLRARGRVRSRPVEEIVARARKALAGGSRELLVASQDNGAYGADRGSGLAELLRALAELPGEFRLRVGMLNPALAAPRATELAAAWDDPRTYRFLHLPVQSGSQAMLDAMGRDHTLAEFWRVVETFRARHPGLMLATDVIAGFPGETDDHHRATVALLERLQPELVYVTRFSPRDGTPAAGFPQQILSRTAKERSRELTRLRLRLARRRFGRLVGSRQRVLAIAHRKPGTTFCRDDSYRPVVLGRELPPGKFATVEITGATATYLRGRLA